MPIVSWLAKDARGNTIPTKWMDSPSSTKKRDISDILWLVWKTNGQPNGKYEQNLCLDLCVAPMLNLGRIL